MKLDALNLNGVARDTMRQIQETMILSTHSMQAFAYSSRI